MASKLIVQLIKTAEPRTGRYTPWDAGLKGFGLRVNGASKSYVMKYLFEDRQRWPTIGKHGQPWTHDTARTEALRLLAGPAPGPSRRRLSTRGRAQT